jgi:hypothetical protein
MQPLIKVPQEAEFGFDNVDNNDKKTDDEKQAILKNLFYSDNLYTPEALFSSWLNLSFFSVTTSLLFFNMMSSKPLEADPKIAAFLAISLIVISCAYIYFSIGPYWKRMNNIEKMCREFDECSDAQLASISKHKRIYIFLGYGTILIEALIAALIVYKSRQLI